MLPLITAPSASYDAIYPPLSQNPNTSPTVRMVNLPNPIPMLALRVTTGPTRCAHGSTRRSWISPSLRYVEDANTGTAPTIRSVLYTRKHCHPTASARNASDKTAPWRCWRRYYACPTTAVSAPAGLRNVASTSQFVVSHQYPRTHTSTYRRNRLLAHPCPACTPTPNRMGESAPEPVCVSHIHSPVRPF